MQFEIINQILNNFFKVSKFTLKVTKISDGINTFFSIPNPLKIEISIETKQPPPYIVFTNNKILKMIPYTNIENIYIDSKELSKKEAIILAGLIDIKKKPLTESEMLQNLNYHALSYYYLEHKKNKNIFALAIYKAGLEEEAIKILKESQDDESKIILAKIYREKNELKKSLELLSSIQTKNFEIHKNLEYGWLHFKTNKPQNSIKIFEYYKNISDPFLRQEVLMGLAISLKELYPEKLNESIKILEEAREIDGFSKEEILKKIASLYLEIKDSFSALKIYNQIYELTSNINLIPTIFKLAKENNQDLQIINDLAIFNPDDAKKLSEGIKIPPNSNVKELEEIKSNDLVESLLVAEDITKTSQKTNKETINISSNISSNSSINKTYKNSIDNIIENKAFEFIRQLESEYSKKIHFNLEGLDDTERKIRITTMTKINENELIEILTQASYFLIYLIKERFKSKVTIYENLDIWSANITIKNKKGIELTTYPAARIFKFKWDSTPPQHGYLRKYLDYLNSFMEMEEEPPYGKIAVKQKAKSDEQKIFDAQIEHKKILEIAHDIKETSYLSPNSSLLPKFEKELRKYFKPNIPPTIDGWKILRCFAHIFLEMILKDFSPKWYCVEKNDGLWSFELPNKIFIFPIGKLYKAALIGESLEEYYAIIRKNVKPII